MRFFFAHPVLPSVRARSARVGTGERESGRVWGQQLVVRGQLHLPTVKLVMRVARVAPKRARCFNSKGTSFHVVLELEHVKPVDQRSAIRKADAVLPAFARAGQRHDTLKRVAQRGRCRLLYLFGVKHVENPLPGARASLNKEPPSDITVNCLSITTAHWCIVCHTSAICLVHSSHLHAVGGQ